MVYSYFPVLVNKNPTYKSELDILHFYQVWISVKIQQKNKENPSLIQLGNLGIFPVKVTMLQGSKFIFDFGSTCATRCKFLGALPKF